MHVSQTTAKPGRWARVVWGGAVHEAREHEDGLILTRGHHTGRVLGLDQVQWLPPLAPVNRPRTVLALGLNYADHARELAFKPPEEPMVFIKSATGLIGHKGVTVRPRGIDYMHYECELAIVIGKTASKVLRQHAYEYIAGYCVANDYAIRDYLENWFRPNLRVKNRDTGTPLGPWLVDAEQVDPMNLALKTTVNGNVTQQGSTRDMIFDVPSLIEYFTQFMTLSPGDVILTGTPDGIVDCKPGDIVITEVEGLGALVNHVVAPPDSRSLA
ncbi:MAG: fumarylacetoacetate hydrolase family protein [Alcaligenaceae bacterium]|nr:fumarylacetoacetate hydrolase family protein [Alcaligenaceae bacterium]